MEPARPGRLEQLLKENIRYYSFVVFILVNEAMRINMKFFGLVVEWCFDSILSMDFWMCDIGIFRLWDFGF